MYGLRLASSVWDQRSHADENRLESHDESQSYGSREEDRRSSSVHRRPSYPINHSPLDHLLSKLRNYWPTCIRAS